MSDTRIVLTYHSISDAGGPTSIAPTEFAMQMKTLVDAGYRSQRLGEFIDWHDGARETGKHVLITFDDAFADYANVAAPILDRHGFTALVFVPTAQLGRAEEWEGANRPARPLLDWATLRALARDGTEFGGHSRTHADLTKLDATMCEAEIAGCGEDLEAQLGRPIESFAAPYGRVTPQVVETIARHYRVAFGTRLALARRQHDRFALPRIEMHYFRDRRRWQGLLDGNLGYLRVRQGLRAVRENAGGWLG
jgi:peptidoglycan/xylan/chitin deacetylase (PgdA/CDA1 family)